MDKGPDERVDDDELECGSVLEGDRYGGCECDNSLECVIDLDLASRLCDWYSEGRGKYVCREDAEVGVRSLPREYLLL